MTRKKGARRAKKKPVTRSSASEVETDTDQPDANKSLITDASDCSQKDTIVPDAFIDNNVKDECSKEAAYAIEEPEVIEESIVHPSDAKEIVDDIADTTHELENSTDAKGDRSEDKNDEDIDNIQQQQHEDINVEGSKEDLDIEDKNDEDIDNQQQQHNDINVEGSKEDFEIKNQTGQNANRKLSLDLVLENDNVDFEPDEDETEEFDLVLQDEDMSILDEEAKEERQKLEEAEKKEEEAREAAKKQEDKTREAMLKIVEDTLKCKLCGNLCVRGITVKCCGTQACRMCATGTVLKSKECWACKKSMTSEDFVNDTSLREAVASFKKDKSVSNALMQNIMGRLQGTSVTKDVEKSKKGRILVAGPLEMIWNKMKLEACKGIQVDYVSREKPMHWSGEGADKFAEGSYDKLVIFFSPSEAEQHFNVSKDASISALTTWFSKAVLNPCLAYSSRHGRKLVPHLCYLPYYNRQHNDLIFKINTIIKAMCLCLGWPKIVTTNTLLWNQNFDCYAHLDSEGNTTPSKKPEGLPVLPGHITTLKFPAYSIKGNLTDAGWSLVGRGLREGLADPEGEEQWTSYHRWKKEGYSVEFQFHRLSDFSPTAKARVPKAVLDHIDKYRRDTRKKMETMSRQQMFRSTDKLTSLPAWRELEKALSVGATADGDSDASTTNATRATTNKKRGATSILDNLNKVFVSIETLCEGRRQLILQLCMKSEMNEIDDLFIPFVPNAHIVEEVGLEKLHVTQVKWAHDNQRVIVGAKYIKEDKTLAECVMAKLARLQVQTYIDRCTNFKGRKKPVTLVMWSNIEHQALVAFSPHLKNVCDVFVNDNYCFKRKIKLRSLKLEFKAKEYSMEMCVKSFRDFFMKKQSSLVGTDVKLEPYNKVHLYYLDFPKLKIYSPNKIMPQEVLTRVIKKGPSFFQSMAAPVSAEASGVEDLKRAQQPDNRDTKRMKRDDWPTATPSTSRTSSYLQSRKEDQSEINRVFNSETRTSSRKQTHEEILGSINVDDFEQLAGSNSNSRNIDPYSRNDRPPKSDSRSNFSSWNNGANSNVDPWSSKDTRNESHSRDVKSLRSDDLSRNDLHPRYDQPSRNDPPARNRISRFDEMQGGQASSRFDARQDSKTLRFDERQEKKNSRFDCPGNQTSSRFQTSPRLDERAGGHMSRFDERPGSHTSRFDERPGSQTSRFDDRLGSHTSRFDDRQGSQTSRFDDRPGIHTSRFDERPGSQTLRLDDRSRSLASSRFVSRPESKTSRFDDTSGRQTSSWFDERSAGNTSRFDEMPDSHMSRVEQRWDSQTSKLEERWDNQTSRFEERPGSQRSRFEEIPGRQLPRSNERPGSQMSRLGESILSQTSRFGLSRFDERPGGQTSRFDERQGSQTSRIDERPGSQTPRFGERPGSQTSRIEERPKYDDRFDENSYSRNESSKFGSNFGRSSALSSQFLDQAPSATTRTKQSRFDPGISGSGSGTVSGDARPSRYDSGAQSQHMALHRSSYGDVNERTVDRAPSSQFDARSMDIGQSSRVTVSRDYLKGQGSLYKPLPSSSVDQTHSMGTSRHDQYTSETAGHGGDAIEAEINAYQEKIRRLKELKENQMDQALPRPVSLTQQNVERTTTDRFSGTDNKMFSSQPVSKQGHGHAAARNPMMGVGRVDPPTNSMMNTYPVPASHNFTSRAGNDINSGNRSYALNVQQPSFVSTSLQQRSTHYNEPDLSANWRESGSRPNAQPPPPPKIGALRKRM